MEATKKHLIFDLDDTLWDFQQNSHDTLLDLFDAYRIGDQGIEVARFIEVFREINNALWDRFDEGLITREVIRKERFPAVFEKLDIHLNGVAMQMQDSFMSTCSAKSTLVKGVKEVLTKFSSTYKFHILSNGFDEIQSIKIKAGGLEPYFDKVITSGRAGFRKPEPEIFDFALNEIGAHKEDCIMIGDNPFSDIEGAFKYGIDQVYYNVHKKACKITPTHIIDDMSELMKIL
ncbi:MAG: YjjG family noncanonical pyrimidine nucleotidase [Cyclobacteriaceae bacterium]|nr:YjjG family noncanonical pyrimidine nucleotidase [Cyclobacteriaceae bacterium]